MCWYICAYRDRHENSCLHDSVLNKYCYPHVLCIISMSFIFLKELCATHFSQGLNLVVLLTPRVHMTCKSNLSTAVLSDASFCALWVLLCLTGLYAHFFKWHASSYIKKSAVVDTCTRVVWSMNGLSCQICRHVFVSYKDGTSRSTLCFPNYPGWPTARQTDQEDLCLKARSKMVIISVFTCKLVVGISHPLAEMLTLENNLNQVHSIYIR